MATAEHHGAGRVDVHHHFLPPRYVEVQQAETAALSPGFTHAMGWTPEASLKEMDGSGVKVAVLSLSTPGMFSLSAGIAEDLSRYCNDVAAQLREGHEGRFLSFAALPLPYVDATLREIERALDGCGAVGVGMLTSYDGVWLGDPSFAPVFDELNRRKALLYVHPTVAPCCRDLIPGVAPAMMEFLFDTARAIGNLLLSGTRGRPYAPGALPAPRRRSAHRRQGLCWACLRGRRGQARCQRCASQARRRVRPRAFTWRPCQRIESIFWTAKDLLTLERHGARTMAGLRERVLQRFLCLAACISLHHRLGRPSRALVDYCA